MDPGSWWGCHVEKCQEMEAWPGILSGIDGAKGFDIYLLKSYTIIFRLLEIQIDRQRLLSQFGLLLPKNIMPEEARVYQVRRVRGRFPCLDKDTPSSYPRPILSHKKFIKTMDILPLFFLSSLIPAYIACMYTFVCLHILKLLNFYRLTSQSFLFFSFFIKKIKWKG